MQEAPLSRYAARARYQHSVRYLVARFRPAIWLAPTLAGSWLAAYLLRFDGLLAADFVRQLVTLLPIILVVKTGAFFAAGITLSCHAFVTLNDAFRLFRATCMATAAVAVVDALFVPNQTIPRGVVLIDGCLTALLVGGALTFRRIHRERRQIGRHVSTAAPALVAGGPAGVELILRAIRCGTGEQYRPLGILTDVDKMLHRAIGGVPVLGTLDAIDSVASETGCRTVLVSGGDLTGGRIREIMAIGQSVGVEIRIVPDVSKIIAGEIGFRPRDVAIEDLLGRPPVEIDQTELNDWLRGRDLLVTGSCGSIGSELVRQLLRFEPRHITLVDRSENGQFNLGRELSAAVERGQVEVVIADVTDLPRMNSLFRQKRPEVVFHAAAYKHVPLMEQHPGEGIKNIIGATKNLADLSNACGVKTFVMISTDKAVNPTSVMGCCKRVAELYVQSMSSRSGCRFVTVRFGNVLGSAGSVIPVFREQIAAGGPVTVTDPRMTRFFMTIPEASQLVIQAAAMGQGGEIFVLDMGTPVRIMDLAEDLIRLSGLRLGHDVEIAISGLRPGEKLYEELYGEEESQTRTQHPKILMANSVRLPRSTIKAQIDQLLGVSESSPETIRAFLKQTVPSFDVAADANRAVRAA